MDVIVERVRKKLLDRSNVGIKKYNTTLFENNKDLFLNHLQQELLDGANYCEKLMEQSDTLLIIRQLSLKEPNDQTFGFMIRKLLQ